MSLQNISVRSYSHILYNFTLCLLIFRQQYPESHEMTCVSCKIQEIFYMKLRLPKSIILNQYNHDSQFDLIDVYHNIYIHRFLHFFCESFIRLFNRLIVLRTIWSQYCRNFRLEPGIFLFLNILSSLITSTHKFLTYIRTTFCF